MATPNLRSCKQRLTRNRAKSSSPEASESKLRGNNSNPVAMNSKGCAADAESTATSKSNTLAPHVSQNVTPCPTVFVANLGPTCSEEELIQVFSSCPGFLKLKMQSTYGAPVAFVDFQDAACSNEALNRLQGTLLYSSPPGEGMRLENQLDCPVHCTDHVMSSFFSFTAQIEPCVHVQNVSSPSKSGLATGKVVCNEGRERSAVVGGDRGGGCSLARRGQRLVMEEGGNGATIATGGGEGGL
ncbi:RNA-binding (RRM/RBD/RNP motifs) family protein [Actinidia rufa]|uniref:RNA-binding (RRM/RBD/RNP motifs) family protein n=1 Tax=Actinidia rufa TaxID=165716 RepID=A0A7J0EJD6_9ERIC|nr:RNA-binding (RRM/RBD/RNP motifs) family protein [Actinidia rufa]